MSRWWFLLLAVMVGLNAALLYDKFARGSEPTRMEARRPHGDRGWREMEPAERRERMIAFQLERMTRDLDLTDDQREQIRAIKVASWDRFVEMRETSRDKRHEIRRLLRATDLDSTRIRDLSASLREDLAVLEAMATDNFIREAAVLTPEQREKYLERRSFGPRGRGGHGKRGGPPPGDIDPPSPEGP